MKKNPLLFRIANQTDFETIVVLHANSWKRAYRGIYTDYYLDHEVENDRRQVWQERLFVNPQNQHVIIAEFDNVPCGFVSIFPNEDQQYGSLIDNLHVKFDFQNMGIGRKLLKEAARWIFTNHKSYKMYLWVLEKNIAAYQFYIRLGALNVETKSYFAPDNSYQNVHRMVWNSFDDLEK
jgi:GNAT superfamily N-acetyltransferase